MSKRNIAIGMGTLALVAILVTSANAAMIGGSGNRPNRAAIESAIASNDYTAFKAALDFSKKPPDAPEITEAVFAKLVEADKLRKAGDYAGAKEIINELGFNKHLDLNKGKGVMMSNLTEEQKAAFDQAKELRQEGKIEEAKKVLLDAGIKRPVRTNK